MSGDEHSEQVAVVAYLQMSYPDVLFWSTPNGAMRGGGRAGAIRMNALKAEGLLPGVSDLILFELRGGYSAMFIEMKRADGGSGASENQLWFLREVEKRGAFGIVCNGYDEAQPVIDDYLAGRIVKQVLDFFLNLL
jgi:hypothetical protein